MSEDNSPLLGCYGDPIATTPNIDALAEQGIRFAKAYANAPVCAPARATLITGMYASSLGLENMRSSYSIPENIRFYPHYLREAGYYTTNNFKKDYNTTDQPEVWDESSRTASYSSRRPGQPFFHIYNLNTTHESRLHMNSVAVNHDPAEVVVPPVYPDSPLVRNDLAVYYDRIQEMDEQVGAILKELDLNRLSDSTIVFYFSDHGGAMPGSKRFLFEYGLHVPLIVRIPRLYKHLLPANADAVSQEIVSFVDFAPTLLSLAGADIPSHMQGRAFLGPERREGDDLAFAFRGRMDERIDCSRTVVSRQYRYTRNYMPGKIYGQKITYLWQAPTMQLLERAHRRGQLTALQDRFFQEKPFEELYDIENDPYCTVNLAGDPALGETLDRLRRSLDRWQLEIRDAGLIPEAMLAEFDSNGHIEDFTSSSEYDISRIMRVASLSADRSVYAVDTLLPLIRDTAQIVRYWALNGLLLRSDSIGIPPGAIENAMNTSHVSGALIAAELLLKTNRSDRAVRYLGDCLGHPNAMVRVQALDIVSRMGAAAQVFESTIREYVRPRDDRGYDNRLYWEVLDQLSEEHR